MTLVKRPLSALALALLVVTVPAASFAQSDGGQRRGPDLGAMAQALGVSEGLMQSCIPRPEQGAQPARPDVNAITACLRAENRSLSPERVGEVLEKHSPAPPPRG